MSGDSSSENEIVATRGKYSSITCQQKEIFIKLYNEGKTISESAAIANIKVNTGKTILYKYKQADEELVIKGRGGNRQAKVTEDTLNFIEEQIERNPCLTLRQMKDLVFETKQINLSTQTIANSLKKLKITLKKASIELDRVNKPRTLELRKDYALYFTQNAPENRENIFFLDESGFNLHLRRTRARSRQGTSATVVVPTVRGRNVTLIGAISVEGVIHQNILPNVNCNSARFCSFIRELLDKIQSQHLLNVWLVMDNAAIHKTQQVKELVESSSARLVFLPPYSPMLNPIEQVFSKVKIAVRRILSEDRANVDLVHVINEGLQTVCQNDCNNYITNMLMKLPQAVDNQPLH